MSLHAVVKRSGRAGPARHGGARRADMVFRSCALRPHMTVQENVALPASRRAQDAEPRASPREAPGTRAAQDEPGGARSHPPGFEADGRRRVRRLTDEAERNGARPVAWIRVIDVTSGGIMIGSRADTNPWSLSSPTMARWTAPRIGPPLRPRLARFRTEVGVRRRRR